MSVIERWIVHYAGGAHIFDNEDDARHAAAPAMLRVEGPFVLDLDQRLQGAVDAIAAHRTAIESAGTINVADEESRRRAEIKHAADLALWQFDGRSTLDQVAAAYPSQDELIARAEANARQVEESVSARDRAAQALCEAAPPAIDLPWSDLPATEREPYYLGADAVLAAIDNAGAVSTLADVDRFLREIDAQYAEMRYLPTTAPRTQVLAALAAIERGR